MKSIQQTLFKEYPTYEALLKDLSPDKLLAAFSQIEHIEQSIAKKRVSLRDLTDLYTTSVNTHPGADYVTRWIEYLSKYINVKPLIETRATAFSMYNDYKHFYLADMKLLLEKTSKAEYGRDCLFFGCIDVQRLSFCFRMYNQERIRINGRFYENMNQKFENTRKQIEEQERGRIYREVTLDHPKQIVWEIFNERCQKEIPSIVEAKLEEFINNQSNGNPGK